jgi:histidyl-tRNA synthetase
MQQKKAAGLKASKLSTDPYKGVRDFYPEDMAMQEYIFGIWKKTAESFGYEQYNASVLEPAELFKAKSGEEIINRQTYTFTDRGDREVTLRPEMTPTVARMVAARKRELSFPLRWYSVANIFRYEQPQRGRVREHWQLNADIFGSDSVEADVETISLAYKVMKNFGAKDGDFEIRLNSRLFLDMVLEKELELSTLEEKNPVLKILDASKKNPEWKAELEKMIGSDKAEKLFAAFKKEEAEKNVTGAVWNRLSDLGIKNIVWDGHVVRGADYYTGVIFEIFDTDPVNRRSLFGGGRYDDLTSLFAPSDSVGKIPAVGFGMGDVTIRDFLETHKLLPSFKSTTDIHICTLEERFIPEAEALAAKLRAKGTAVSVNLTAKKIGDQIGWADKHHIPKVIVIGDEEVKTGKYKVKTLATGEETEMES